MWQGRSSKKKAAAKKRRSAARSDSAGRSKGSSSADPRSKPTGRKVRQIDAPGPGRYSESDNTIDLRSRRPSGADETALIGARPNRRRRPESSTPRRPLSKELQADIDAVSPDVEAVEDSVDNMWSKAPSAEMPRVGAAPPNNGARYGVFGDGDESDEDATSESRPRPSKAAAAPVAVGAGTAAAATAAAQRAASNGVSSGTYSGWSQGQPDPDEVGVMSDNVGPYRSDADEVPSWARPRTDRRGSSPYPPEDQQGAGDWSSYGEAGTGQTAAALTAARMGPAGTANIADPGAREMGIDPDPEDPTAAYPQGGGGRQRPRGGGDPKARERARNGEMSSNRRRKQKPKEPNYLVLGLAILLVLLAGLGVAYFMTRGDGGETEAEQQAAATADGTETAPADTEVSDPAAPTEEAPTETTVPQPVVDNPTLVFPEAEAGPLQVDTTYSIELLGAPEGADLQVVVDNLQQAEPRPVLPDLVLPEGRHDIWIEISTLTGVTTSNVIPVFVLGESPAAGWRANLSSVDLVTEGWAEAIRQYDEFRAAGHENLRLTPSDPYPSLAPGFWNIYVDGFAQRDAASGYCESFGLAIPDQCFPKEFDPTAPASSDG